MNGIKLTTVFIGIDERRLIDLAFPGHGHQVRTHPHSRYAFARTRCAPGRVAAVGLVLDEDQVAACAATVFHVGDERHMANGDGVVIVPLHGRGHVYIRQRKA
ncbi:hypothetical protein D3C87_1273810 [compost metagenome]